MRELIGRLEVVDDTAASALRVIAHFDDLVTARVSVPALQRAAAALAGCPVGLHDSAAAATVVVDRTGVKLATQAPEATTRAVTASAARWTVWTARSGGPLDELILERLLRALQARESLREDTRVEVAVRIACDAELSPPERAAALEVLRLHGTVTVAALANPPEFPAARRAVLDGVTVLLLAAGETLPGLPPGQLAGTATVPADSLPLGWARARLALRLAPTAYDCDGTLDHAGLGPLAALADITPPRRAAELPDVARLTELAAAHPWVPETLYLLVGSPSARQTAARLRLHHSTLQERTGWLEDKLGYSLRTPAGRHRASLTVSLWRIGLLAG